MPAYAAIAAQQREIALLGASLELLSWDQETAMPAAANALRTAQIGQLTRLQHQWLTEPSHLARLREAAADERLEPIERCNVEGWLRRAARAEAVPTALAGELAETACAAMAAWRQARSANDFAAFAPWLTKIIALKRREAEAIGWADEGEAWDALADAYDPGMSAAAVAAAFDPLREQLQALIDELRGAPSPPDGRFLDQRLPVAAQRALLHEVMAALGFDFERGLTATSAHPFCAGEHPHDVRLTTRYDEAQFSVSLLSGIHECGHALYQQGLPVEHFGAPAGSANGLSIHESQSRLWENQVARSPGFLRWLMPHCARHGLAHTDAAAALRALNRCQPSLIRVDADEATYNLHIMVRFALERALLNGELAAAELPGAWNEAYRHTLGIAPPDDASGCLQDVHWSMGALGYFPTYTLGNLYAAQFYAAAERELGDQQAAFAAGNFAPLLGWLRAQIHHSGQRLRPAEQCVAVSGEPLNPRYLLDYLAAKLRPLHGLH